MYMYDDENIDFSLSFFLFLSSSFSLSVYAHTNSKDGKKEQVKKGFFTFYVQRKANQGRVVVESNDVFFIGKYRTIIFKNSFFFYALIRL